MRSSKAAGSVQDSGFTFTSELLCTKLGHRARSRLITWYNLRMQDGIYETLLRLGDACPSAMTRREVLRLLDVLPTWPGAVQVMNLLSPNKASFALKHHWSARAAVLACGAVTIMSGC